MAATSAAAIRQAVQRIIDADLSVEEIRCAVMSLVPVEYHRPADHSVGCKISVIE